jgi:hypothetical protein
MRIEELGKQAKELVTTPGGRRFVGIAITVGVGYPLAMRPLLGTLVVPGLTPLLTVLTKDLQTEVVPFSVISVTFVALILEFVYRDPFSDRALKWSFFAVMTLLFCALTALFLLQDTRILKVPIDGGRGTSPIIFTPTRVKGCSCGDRGDLECVDHLSLRPAALRTCWGGPALVHTRWSLAGSYVLTLTCLTAAIGLIVLRLAGAGRKAAARRRRRRKKSPPAAPAPSDSVPPEV